MRAEIVIPERVELSISSPGNLLLVQNHTGEVCITAAHDNFSTRKKLSFIRYLAAEGVIADRHQSLVCLNSGFGPRIKWLIGHWLLQSPAERNPKALGQILRLIFYVRLIWAATMTWVVLHSVR